MTRQDKTSLKGIAILLASVLLQAVPVYGQTFVWAKQMGGSSADQALGVAVDSNGNVYTTGRFQSTADFDPGPGTSNLTSAGSWDIFVSKLDSAGDFVWAKRMGGSNVDQGRGVAVDSNGNVYTTGFFESTADFDPGPGTSNLTAAGILDIFVSKLDSAGDFVWAKRMGSNVDEGIGVAVDSNGNVYTTGYFESTADFDPGPGTSNLTSAGSEDIFVSKLDSAGDFVWAKRMGGSNVDQGRGVAVDSNGNVYTTGYFQSTADFDPGPGTSNLTSAGSLDTFVSKLDSAGDFVWAKRIGGDEAHGVAVDSNGNVYTTGAFQGTADFDPGPGTSNLTSAGSLDIFVSKLDSAGDFVWAKRMGGWDFDQARGVAVDSNGNVYTTGLFPGTADFDPGPGTSNLTSAGHFDIFVSKLDSAGDFVWAERMGGSSADQAWGGVVVDSNGNVYTTGLFQGTADFDPGPGTSNLTSAGSADIFVSKLGQELNLPPTADAGPDQIVECMAPGGTDVTLDGSSSSDPDLDILTYTWTGPFPEGGGTVAGVSPVITLLLSGSARTVTLTVEDPSAETDSDTVDITIQDTASPLLALTNTFVEVVPTTPTGTMVDVLATSGVTVSDACDPNPNLTHDAPAEFPIGATTDVRFTATDASGNIGSQVFSVTVLTASEATEDLIQDVLSLQLQTGVENALEQMLNSGMNVLDDMNEVNDGAAVNSLVAFIAATEAQRGKKLTDAQADQLIVAAQTIIAALGG